MARSKAAIIESMKSDSFTAENKRAAWTQIATLFNSKFPDKQISAKQASDKWHAHKKEAKAAAAKQRHAVMATGNSTMVEEIGTEDAKTMSILDQQTQPINYGKDSDKMPQKPNPKSPI